jgi:phage-related minor tail protein
MALEPAGVSLQAQNFNKYIKQLGKIEKSQQAIFDVDSSKLDKGFDNATKKASNFSNSISQGAKKGTSGFKALGGAASAAGTAATVGLAAVATGAVAAAAAVGAVSVAVFNIASDTDQATKQIAASLGITAAQAADKYNDSLQRIFVDNPQAQFEEIAEAIALTERALDLDTAGIEQVAGDALKLQQTFGSDLQKTIGASEQLIEKFGLSGQQATDLLAFGLQNIPVDDLIDSIGQYSNQFAQAGFTADEFFSILASGAAGGELGTDRAADAVKELQIRFLEGNKSLTDSFGVLGLNFNQLTQDVNTGQKTISDVFGLVVDRAGQVDLSVAANRAAIAGLGTQFEDLGAAAIAALDPDAIGFEDVAGAAGKLDERFNNLGDAFTSVKRSALVSLAPIGQTVLELANSIVPKIRLAFETARPAIEAFAARVVPALQFAAQGLGRLAKSLGLASSGASTFEAVLDGVAFVIEGVAGGIEILVRVSETLKQVFALAKAGAAAFGSLISDVFTNTINNAGAVGKALLNLVKLDFAGAAAAAKEFEFFDIGASLDKAGVAAIEKLKGITAKVEESPIVIPVEIGGAGPGAGPQALADSFNQQADAIGVSEEALKSYQATLKQAEQLQLSFSRAAEDTAIKLARANEDVARKQAKSVADLEEKQRKDRDKLLKDQQKQLDKFEKDRQKQIAKAEDDIAKARKDAAEKRKADQQKLQRELQRAQESFNLSQLQSERRFSLSERRLRAEGDILAIQQLREDRELERKEEAENFGLSKKEQIQSAEEQQREQAKDLESRVNELKANLEEQRAELLQSFDEQFAAQQQAQVEARAQQQQGFAAAAAEREIALRREEEDRRLSQQRQLEDLGSSLADQQGVTEEGVNAIAGELEKVFGQEGVADNIFGGFKKRTESDFKDLFEDLSDIVSDVNIPEPKPVPASLPGIPGRIGGIQELQEGGVVGGPGPIGSPQTITAHKGETFLPTHQRSFTMAAPVIPSQTLNVDMSGGFNITGDGQGDEAILQAAAAEMTEMIRIAVRRLARRN